MLKDIYVLRPNSAEELYNIVQYLSENLSKEDNIRLLILDSLSYPIQCCVNPTTRTEIYFQMMNLIQQIQRQNNLIVLIVNELTTQMNYNGKLVFESAGGKLLAHRIDRKIKLTRKDDNNFTACILKSPLSSKNTVIFQITQDGIKDKKI